MTETCHILPSGYADWDLRLCPLLCSILGFPGLEGGARPGRWTRWPGREWECSPRSQEAPGGGHSAQGQGRGWGEEAARAAHPLFTPGVLWTENTPFSCSVHGLSRKGSRTLGSAGGDRQQEILLGAAVGDAPETSVFGTGTHADVLNTEQRFEKEGVCCDVPERWRWWTSSSAADVPVS